MKLSLPLNFAKLSLSAGVLIFSLCGQATEKRTIKMIKLSGMRYMEIVEADSISVCWDPPAISSDTVAYYELFFRSQKDSGWTLAKGNIPASQTPNQFVRHSDLSPTDSIFYFGVRSVAKSGMKSDFHFSTDSSAGPAGGWFVMWRPK